MYDLVVSLRIAALGLLAQHPGSGYDLLKRFEKSMANVWPATQSQLYGELNKLAETGLIEVTDIGPRGRKEYRVTDAGRAELRRWVTNPQDDPPYRSAELLRVFLLGEIPPAQAREYMRVGRRGMPMPSLSATKSCATRRLGRRRRRFLRPHRAGVRAPKSSHGGRVGTLAGQGHRQARQELNVASR